MKYYMRNKDLAQGSDVDMESGEELVSRLGDLLDENSKGRVQVVNFQRCERAPVCQLLYCTTVLFKVLYCKILNVFFIFCVCFLMYYLCEKYYKPITGQYYKPISVQYFIADCVSWVPGLTLWNFRTNWTYQHALGMELVHM